MQKFMCYCTALAFLILNMRAISEYKPPGAYIWRGYLSDGFLRYEFGGLMFGGGGLIHGRAYFSDFYGIGLHNSDQELSETD